MKDIETVCARYEVKLRQSEQGRAAPHRAKEQVARYRAALIHTQQFLLETRAVLDMEGVSTITRGFYLSFARSLDKLKRQGLSGESLAIEAAILMSTWVARGLSQHVLETIRTQVFDVGPPTP